MVDDLRKLCLSKDDFNVVNTIGRGHFGQVQRFLLKANSFLKFLCFALGSHLEVKKLQAFLRGANGIKFRKWFWSFEVSIYR